MHVIESEARPGRPPGVTRPGPDGLTARQAAIVAFIEQAVARKGYPPSMREIGEGVRLRSTSSVAHQLMALERKGFLYRDPHRPRAYRVRSGWPADLPCTRPAWRRRPSRSRWSAASRPARRSSPRSSSNMSCHYRGTWSAKASCSR